MEMPGKIKSLAVPDHKASVRLVREQIRELLSLSGGEALNLIQDHDNPRQLVRSIARVDFYWLVKKMGEDDSLPLLALASHRQWEYLLDMELWQKDRLDLEQASLWLDRLQKASPERLVKWLYKEGEHLCHFYFFRNIQVEIRRRQEAFDLPNGFFTLDNIYYIRILDKEHEEVIASLLRHMAAQDYDRYEAVLLGLAGVLPAEAEDEMYRTRNVRLAEDGFLSFEEAITLYSYLKAEALVKGPAHYALEAFPGTDSKAMVPIIPMLHVRGGNLLAECAEGISDPIFLDRLGIEFAGLCNQLLSADLVVVNNLEALIKTCRKAVGYVNLGLEKLSGGSVAAAEGCLRDHSLISIFRVGFGLTLELKWEVERWIKTAWFMRMDLEPNFWGEDWGGVLLGMMEKRPLFFTGYAEEEAHRPFEQMNEIENCRAVLKRVFVMDRLLGIITSSCPLDKSGIQGPLFTFHALPFTFWARQKLNLDPGFEPLLREQVKDFFRLIRGEGEEPPYRMSGLKGAFIKDLMSEASDFDEDNAGALEATLSLLWQEFSEEYAWVRTDDLDPRFARFILSRPSSQGDPE